MSTKAELELKSALLSTGLVQPVESKGRGGYVEVLCRQVPGQEKAWLGIIHELLKAAEASEFKAEFHICRRYLLKDKALVYGWHVAIKAPDGRVAGLVVDDLARVLSKAKPVLESAVKKIPVKHRQAVEEPEPSPAPRAQPRAVGVHAVERGVDGKGKAWMVEEMPLPHVSRDLNIPNSKGRGARGCGGE